MTMPTRRAVRPDSKHHRDARRQRITGGSGRRGIRGMWGVVALAAMIGLVICGAVAMFASQPHAWVRPTMYVSIAALVCAIVASWSAIRG